MINLAFWKDRKNIYIFFSFSIRRSRENYFQPWECSLHVEPCYRSIMPQRLVENYFHSITYVENVYLSYEFPYIARTYRRNSASSLFLQTMYTILRSDYFGKSVLSTYPVETTRLKLICSRRSMCTTKKQLLWIQTMYIVFEKALQKCCRLTMSCYRRQWTISRRDNCYWFIVFRWRP
jgi:hypothetical protein